MEQYIDKSALVAEIERRLEEYRTYPDYQIDSNYMELCDILSFLNTLEVKEVQEEPSSEDLEEFALQYAGHHAPYDSCMQEVEDAVKAGAKWQKQKYSMPVSEDLEEAAVEAFKQIVDADKNNFLEIFKAGAKWQKEQFEKECADICNGIASLKGLLVSMTYHRGVADGKEQIMKDATEAIVKVDAGGYPYIPQIELYDYDKDVPLAKEGEKYKVILIKGE